MLGGKEKTVKRNKKIKIFKSRAFPQFYDIKKIFPKIYEIHKKKALFGNRALYEQKICNLFYKNHFLCILKDIA